MQNWQMLNVVSIVAGLALVLSPWLLSYAGEDLAAWHSWIAGTAVALISVGALVSFNVYEEWANLVVGLWVVSAPWVFGFSGLAAALWAHLIVGVIVAALAAGSLCFSRNRPLSAT